jgi:Na+-driven multidrug efflux pump
MATLCIQWWSSEIAIIMTGKLGENDQGAAVILFSLISFLDQSTKGIRKGVAIYVGQSVGKSDIPLAKKYLYLAQ